ncbi:MAG: uroporphyrinogen-III C-methyltransferase [Oleiphilaceae bacterium]|nr:uroporphyrinogen-III C-methyltransferase [Oleiphilaceae bacterium]
MTELDASLPSPATAPPRKTSKLGILVAILLLITMLTLAALSFYFWSALQQQDTKLALGSDYKRVIEQRMDSLERNLLRLNETQTARQAATQKALEELAQRSEYTSQQLLELNASSRSDWLLAEAEYLLRLANQRLNIERDVRGAEAILIAADKVLSEVDDPGLLPVRVKLAEDIFALQSIKSLDRDGLYSRLDAAIAGLQSLDDNSLLDASLKPLIADEPSTEATEQDTWSAFGRQLLRDLKQAFVIRRLDRPVEPLLAPEQSYYLRQNLRLMLEQASLALLEGKQEAYHRNLEKADDWLNRYFDGSHGRVVALRESIGYLQLQRIEQSLPDISGSLKLLKNKLEAMYRHHQLDKHTTVKQQQENAQ